MYFCSFFLKMQQFDISIGTDIGENNSWLFVIEMHRANISIGIGTDIKKKKKSLSGIGDSLTDP